MNRAWRASLLLVVVASCSGEDATPTYLPLDELQDPETCLECHADHHREWSGSMHAYASRDPVFLAMNARGQRETDGALGDFCVRCHAPMAVLTGATTDGLNLPELPEALQGVTCYFCHSVVAVEGTHSNPLRLADDGVMRGGIANPTPNPAHAAAYSPLHDRERLESATLCGSCHDIVTPAGVHLERTFQEWASTGFADQDNPDALTCGGCHMEGRDGVAAQLDGVPLRRVHSHMMPGVDVALTPFPERDAQLAAVQDALDTSLLAELCVSDDRVVVTLENVAAGHSWPSGATQDRRAWVEVVAYAGEREVYRSGVVEDGQAVATVAQGDPDLWQLRDHIVDAEGNEVHMFWDAAAYRSELLPAPTTLSPLDPGYVDPHVAREYTLPEPADRVTLRVRIRPMGLDVLGDLVASGDLDPSFIAAMPTFTLAATTLEWRAELGVTCIP